MGESNEEPEVHLSSATLIATIIILVYTVATPIFKKIKLNYFHESGICMLIGMLISFIAMKINPDVNY